MRDPPWVLSFSQNCGTTNKTKSQLCSDGQFVLWLEKQEAERNSSKSNKGLELLLKIKGEQLPSKCEAFVQIPASQTKGKGRNRSFMWGIPDFLGKGWIHPRNEDLHSLAPCIGGFRSRLEAGWERMALVGGGFTWAIYYNEMVMSLGVNSRSPWCIFWLISVCLLPSRI